MYSVMIYTKDALCKSRKQRRPLTRIEQPAHRIARVDAIDRLREQLAHRELPHLPRLRHELWREGYRVGDDDLLERGALNPLSRRSGE